MHDAPPAPCPGATAYTYDVENQLTRIDIPDGTFASYRYDGLGRRIEKDVNGAITRYVYDQEDIVLQYQYGGTSHCLTHAYLHGPGID
ncbi:MAG TPA: RHS repeat domain-containing protein [bacterium]